jgi:hypothetical protein
MPTSGLSLLFVPVLSCFEDFVEIGAFRGCGAKGCVLLRGDVEVAVDASPATINDGEDPGLIVIGHGGDDAGGHFREDSRKLKMQ